MESDAKTRSMKAVVFDGTLALAHDYPVPVPPAGEALVRVLLSGICATDKAILRGYAGFRGVLGHEFVGVVERTDEPGLAGRRVTGDINVTCGQCPACLAGRPTHCHRRTTLGIHTRDGALAEFLTLPARNLHLVPEAVPDEQAVFAEPLAAACRILQQVRVDPTDRVVVLGDGTVGLLVAQVLALTGCQLVVAGHHADHLAILSARGVETVLDGQVSPGADIVVECTGDSQGFEAAYGLVRAGGTLVLKSTYHGPFPVDLVRTVVGEVHIVGSRCGPMDPALRLLAARLVDVTSLIEAVYALEEALAAFERAGRRGALKVLVRP